MCVTSAAGCREAGRVFQPMIFESLSGVSAEAAGVIESWNRAVADNIDSPESEVANRFWWGLSMDIQKAQHRALARRTRGVGMEELLGGCGALGMADPL